MRVNASIVVAAPIESVWAIVTDPERVLSYMSGVTRWEVAGDVRIGLGAADLLLGYDPIVSVAPSTLSRLEEGVTRAVVNAYVSPPAALVTAPDLDLQHARMRRALREAVGVGRLDILDATRMAAALLGDGIAGNLLLLGFAYQKGLIPLSGDALRRAIGLNGAAVHSNQRAFAWGRVAAADMKRVEDALGPAAAPSEPDASLDALIARRRGRLVAYQNETYAARYATLVEEARAIERGVDPGSETLARTVAESLYKLMAYKDEYEVARLYSENGFWDRLKNQFEGEIKVQISLAPPLFGSRDRVSGNPGKRTYGAWMFAAMRVLARLKGLRGTAFDPFGRLPDRRLERELIADYEALLRELFANLRRRNLDTAIALARLPMKIRGFGHVKLARLELVRGEQTDLLRRFREPAAERLAS